jgi:haloacetate dehalogenase
MTAEDAIELVGLLRPAGGDPDPLPMDAEDRDAGRKIQCPVLVHWGAEEDPRPDGSLPVWRRWADDVRGGPLPGGHFIPEEASDELLASLRQFLVE